MMDKKVQTERVRCQPMSEASLIWENRQAFASQRAINDDFKHRQELIELQNAAKILRQQIEIERLNKENKERDKREEAMKEKMRVMEEREKERDQLMRGMEEENKERDKRDKER